MKRIGVIAISGALLMSSCSSYTGTGAYVGAQFGTILGSAIGGITGGWRGSDVGSIVGMAGGAVVGAAVGASIEKSEKEKIEGYHKAIERKYGQTEQDTPRGVMRRDSIDMTMPEVMDSVNAIAPEAMDSIGRADSGFDQTNSGDDRIFVDIAGPAVQADSAVVSIEIRNARFTDANRDGILSAGEECQVVFEIMNVSDQPVYDVQPVVTDVSGNKYIHISPNLHVESIAPKSGVRYTATILADKKLRDGTATIRVSAAVGGRELTAQGQEILVPTRRK